MTVNKCAKRFTDARNKLEAKVKFDESRCKQKQDTMKQQNRTTRKVARTRRTPQW